MTVIAKRLLTTAAAGAALLAAGAASAQTPVGAPQPSLGAPTPVAQGASPPPPIARAPAGIDDPWEATNRKLFNFNRVLNRVAIRPGVVFYHHATPTPVRHGLHNVLVNAGSPMVIVNYVLQLRPIHALNALGRFTINSTVGIGGVFDVAGKDFPFQSTDFGVTMARYGVPTGPYLFVPLLGPTTIRDGAGRIVDGVADPLNSVNYAGRDVLAPVRAVLVSLDAADRLEPTVKYIDRTATDPYATIRSAYFQNRAAQARGEVTSAANLEALPDFGPEPAAGAGASAPSPTATPPETASPDGGATAPTPQSTVPGPSASLQPADPVGDLLASLPANAAPATPMAVAALD
ncbi:MAG: VacJ family lipoprotein [Caulobacteraceae bacterium]|nr:VacJ family lipoprotein [Caulobacter sp.]